MRRGLILAILLGLILAAPFGWGELRRRELVGLADREPVVTLRAESWRVLADGFRTSASWAALVESAAGQRALATPRGRDFQDTWRGLNGVLDEDPVELVLRTFGHRVEGGVWLRPTGGFAVGLVALPEAGTDVADVAERVRIMASTSGREAGRDVDGTYVFPVGNGGALALGNGVAAFASAETFALDLARRFRGRLEDREPLPVGLSLEVDRALLGSALRPDGSSDPWLELAASILAGGLLHAYDGAESVRIDLRPAPAGFRAEIRLHTAAAIQAEVRSMVAAAGPAPIASSREILQARLSRDFAALWSAHRSALGPAGLAQLDALEAQLGEPGWVAELLAELEPHLLLQAREPRGEDAVPGLAITAESGAPELRSRLAQLFAVAIRGTQRPGSLAFEHLDLADPPGVELYGARLAESASAPAWARQSLRPTLALGPRHIVLASGDGLARELVEAAGEPAGDTRGAGDPRDTLVVQARPLADALRARRDLLVEESMQQRGLPREQAQEDIDALLALLDTLDRLRVEVTYAERATRIGISLSTRPAGSPRSL